MGQMLNGKWTVDRLLDVGGMGAVYEATHRNGRRAAIKVLHTRFARDPEVRVAEAEGLDDLDRFDHVLVLRSWNHMRDPERAAAALARALRPGGTMLVSDGVAFGLLRQRPPTTGPGLAFEHFRNDDAGRAHAVLGKHLELLERREVGPDTSSEWLLRYRRA